MSADPFALFGEPAPKETPAVEYPALTAERANADAFAMFAEPAPDTVISATCESAQVDAFALLSEAPTEGTDRPVWHQLPTPLQNLHGHFELPLFDPERITYHTDIVQGSDEWLELRRGILTASEMHLIITPTLKVASNDKERAHVYEIAAQRITGYVEPSYISDDMLRGHEDEIDARIAYGKNYAPVTEIGFITNGSFGFNVGFSPDGLVGDDGLIEIKSRRQKLQIQTIIEGSASAPMKDAMIQMQTGLLVTGRSWCDYISYSGGLEMVTIRVLPDYTMQAAIIEAAIAFEARVQAVIVKYHAIRESGARLIPTERRVEQEITL